MKIAFAFSLSLLITMQTAAQSPTETALAGVRRSDASTTVASGTVPKLAPAEHMRRAAVYLANRAFVEARAHWQALIDNYPQDPHVPEALFGIGRSYFLAKDYQAGYVAFNDLFQRFPTTKEGREALNFSAASLLRMSRFSESAARYEEYINRFPNGERIDTAHLNMIDTLREAGRPADALVWVTKTRQRFAGSATETNAMFAALRLYVAEGEWPDAIQMADQLSQRNFGKAVDTSRAEVQYLRAFSLEQAGRKEEAFAAYLAIPDGVDSYYGWLATEHLPKLTTASTIRVDDRIDDVNSAIRKVADTYPAPYRQSILNAAKARKLDPRFILALIRQESVFKPFAKSPAGARGLLQLTMDAAQKYGAGAGVNALSENQLYQPDTSIALGAEYLKYLVQLFPEMLEPVAASYNGGEDNVARWLERAKHKDPGVFTAEIGFDETKAYVQKVMTNYRVYRLLYTENLIRK